MDLRGPGPVGEESHSWQPWTCKVLDLITGNVDVALGWGGWLTIAPRSSGVWLPLICPSALGAPNPVAHPASQAQTNHWDAVIGPAGILEGSQAWLETICTKVHVQARQGGERESGQCLCQKIGRKEGSQEVCWLILTIPITCQMLHDISQIISF